MATTIPDGFKDLLTTKITFAHLATNMKDGTPQVTPVWFSFDGTNIVVNSAKGQPQVSERRTAPRGSWSS